MGVVPFIDYLAPGHYSTHKSPHKIEKKIANCNIAPSLSMVILNDSETIISCLQSKKVVVLECRLKLCE